MAQNDISTNNRNSVIYSIIIPLYKAEAYLPALMEALESLNRRLKAPMEAVLVLDGLADDSLTILQAALASASFCSILVTHSRNFGSLAAIRSGLTHANGQFFTMLSADLQEPPELVLEIFDCLSTNQVDLAIGKRILRNDSLVSQGMSYLFWAFYRYFVQPEIPPGGVDAFGCNRVFRAHLLDLYESHNVLIGTLFWLGFRRKIIPYQRQPNRYGKSTWTLRRKVHYAVDNISLYSDFPVKLITLFGFAAIAASLFGGIMLYGTHAHAPNVLRYGPDILIALFFGGANAVGLGILGAYLWRILVSTRHWPQAVIMDVRSYSGVSNDVRAPIS
jgi:glycosyltransferase involved in cell wall biosynthesis